MKRSTPALVPVVAAIAAAGGGTTSGTHHANNSIHLGCYRRASDLRGAQHLPSGRPNSEGSSSTRTVAPFIVRKGQGHEQNLLGRLRHSLAAANRDRRSTSR